MVSVLEVVPDHSGRTDSADFSRLPDGLFDRFSLSPEYQPVSMCDLDRLALPAKISFWLAEPSSTVLAVCCGFVVWRIWSRVGRLAGGGGNLCGSAHDA